MNHTVADTKAYAETLLRQLDGKDLASVDLFVLPPFTSLHAANAAFAGTKVGFGGQNMHWEEEGAWTGEISAKMLVEAGCKYVALAHSERLQYFGETYDRVRLKVNTALRHGLSPILCLGENAKEKNQGRTESVLKWQLETALADVSAADVPGIVMAYEPRWAIGAKDAASPEHVADQHNLFRNVLRKRFGEQTAEATRIVYGGSVTPSNGPDLIAIPDVDGLFIGRAAWSPDGLAEIINIVAEAAN
ncbi:MAG: triose-phosphate isomerase [Candidatus Thiodiazotropha sp.]